MQTNPSRVNASQEPDWNAIYDSVPAASKGSEPDWDALYDSVPAPTQAPATPPFLEPGDAGYEADAGYAGPGRPVQFATPVDRGPAPSVPWLADMEMAGRVNRAGPVNYDQPQQPVNVVGMPPATTAEYERRAREEAARIAAGVATQQGIAGQISGPMRVAAGAAAAGGQRINDAVTAWRDLINFYRGREPGQPVQAVPPDVIGELGQIGDTVTNPVGRAITQAAPMVAELVPIDPVGLASMFISHPITRAIQGSAGFRAAKLQFLTEVQAAAGQRAAALTGAAIDDAISGGAFGGVQAGVMGENPIEGALHGAAAGVALGPVARGAGMVAGAAGRGLRRMAEPTARQSDPALVREAVDAMRPGPAPERSTPAVESWKAPTDRAALEAQARDMGIGFTPRTRTVDLRRAVEARQAGTPREGSETSGQSRDTPYSPSGSEPEIRMKGSEVPPGTRGPTVDPMDPRDPGSMEPIPIRIDRNDPHTQSPEPQKESGVSSSVESLPSPNPTPRERQPWEMTREEYAGTIIPEVQGLLKKRMSAERGMENAARRGADAAVDAYRDDFNAISKQIDDKTQILHRRSVEAAIREGKIDSHPDYPELKAEGKAPDAAPASLADRLEAKARQPDAVEEVQQPDDGSDLEPMGQGAGGQGAKWKRSNTPRIEPDPITGKQPKRLSEMTLDLETGLNANVRKGNPGRGFSGVYKPRSQDTVVRFSGDVDTTAHEISHRIDDTYGLVRQWAGNRQRSPFDAELMPHFSQYGSATTSGPRSKLSYQRAEGVAEWMRAWMVNPDAAKKAAPQFAAHFEQTVPADVRARLEAFGKDIREWYGANPVDQAIANVRMDVTNPGLAAKVREAVAPEQAGEYKPGAVTRVKTDLQDDLAPVWEAIALARELKGIDPAKVLPSKDAQTMTRNWAGVDRKVLEVLNHGPRDAQGKKIPGMGGVSWLFEPIANQPKKQLAADYRAVIASMLSERVVDRTAKMQADADAIKKLVAERDQLAKQIAAAGGAANAGGTMMDRYRKVVTDLRALRKKLGFQGDVNLIDAYVQQRASRMAGIGANMVSDLTMARRIIAEVSKDPARKARIDEAAKRYRQWSTAMLEYARDKGRLSDEQFKQITEADDAYVSFARVRTPEEEVLTQMYGSMAGGKKLGSSKDVAKKFMGSTRELENPYASLLNNTHRIIKEVDRNEALRLIADEFTGNRPNAKAPPIDMARFARKVAAEDPNAIRIYRDGEAEFWQFAPELHAAIRGIGDKYDTPTLLKPLRWMASMQRFTITNFPPFMIRNALFRDPMSRAVLSRTGGEKFGHLAYMVSPRQYARDVAELRTFGGALFGNYQPGAEFNHKFIAARMQEMASDGRTILTTPRRLLSVLREKGGEFTEASETVGRLAEFKSAYRHAKAKLGYNDYDAGIYAASQARGLLDYAVAGRRIRPIAQYVAFLNANIQGLAREIGGIKERPARVAAKWAAYVLAPSLLTYWWAAQSDTLDEYRELPAYRRDFFMNFKIGPDTWLSIPKPFTLGVLASGVERTIDRVGGNPDAFRGYAGSLAKSLSPADESALMMGSEPIIEQMANRDFFRDRDIVPPWEEDLDVSLREGTSRASRLGQAVQSMIGVDARRIDHLAQGMFGTAGKLTTMMSDIGRDDRPGQVGKIAAFLSGIVTAGPGSNAGSFRVMLDELRRSGKQGTGLYRDLVQYAKAYSQADSRAERDRITQDIIELSRQMQPMIAEIRKERESAKTAAR